MNNKTAAYKNAELPIADRVESLLAVKQLKRVSARMSWKMKQCECMQLL